MYEYIYKRDRGRQEEAIHCTYIYIYSQSHLLTIYTIQVHTSAKVAPFPLRAHAAVAWDGSSMSSSIRKLALLNKKESSWEEGTPYTRIERSRDGEKTQKICIYGKKTKSSILPSWLNHIKKLHTTYHHESNKDDEKTHIIHIYGKKQNRNILLRSYTHNVPPRE